MTLHGLITFLLEKADAIPQVRKKMLGVLCRAHIITHDEIERVESPRGLTLTLDQVLFGLGRLRANTGQFNLTWRSVMEQLASACVTALRALLPCVGENGVKRQALREAIGFRSLHHSVNRRDAAVGCPRDRNLKADQLFIALALSGGSGSTESQRALDIIKTSLQNSGCQLHITIHRANWTVAHHARDEAGATTQGRHESAVPGAS